MVLTTLNLVCSFLSRFRDVSARVPWKLGAELSAAPCHVVAVLRSLFPAAAAVAVVVLVLVVFRPHASYR